MKKCIVCGSNLKTENLRCFSCQISKRKLMNERDVLVRVQRNAKAGLWLTIDWSVRDVELFVRLLDKAILRFEDLIVD